VTAEARPTEERQRDPQPHADPVAVPIPGMHEASIRAAIAQLQSLLPERSITTRELWDRYASSLPAEKWARAAQSLMIPFLEMFGDVQVSALSAAHWSDYRDDKGIRERYAVGTRNAQLYRLKSMLNWAVATDRIPFSPMAKAKIERAPPERETVINADGEAAMLAELDPLMRAFFLLALDGAMRREEIRLLEWTDIDVATSTVTLPAARTKGRTMRKVTLTSRAIEAVQALPRICDHVFANPRTKRPYDATAIWKSWRIDSAACGLKPAWAPRSRRSRGSSATSACPRRASTSASRARTSSTLTSCSRRRRASRRSGHPGAKRSRPAGHEVEIQIGNKQGARDDFCRHGSYDRETRIR
jgi:integrase